MERIEELISRKREILRYYRERLEKLHGVKMNPEPAGMLNGAWMPTAVFEAGTGVTREKLQEAFAAGNIDARVFFHPLSSLPMFEDRQQNRYAWDIPKLAINLPSYHDLTEENQDCVIKVIKAALQEANDNE